ncbi:MAG: TfoX/Sxy family protein [Actinomycetes bacterium]
MSSDLDLVEYICDEAGAGGVVTYRKMFGEYALYRDDRVVALVCDDQLFVKPTAGGRAYAGEVVEAAPYPGAKPCLLIEDRLDDREWLSELFRLTAAELPAPRRKARSPRKQRARRSE